MIFKFYLVAGLCWSLIFIEMVCPGTAETTKNADERGGDALVDQLVSGARKKNTNRDDFLKRITPMIAMPFIMQTTFLPFALILMKIFLAKSMFLGKLGIIIWIFNILHNRMDTSGHLYSHNINVH